MPYDLIVLTLRMLVLAKKSTCVLLGLPLFSLLLLMLTAAGVNEKHVNYSVSYTNL